MHIYDFFFYIYNITMIAFVTCVADVPLHFQKTWYMWLTCGEMQDEHANCEDGTAITIPTFAEASIWGK